ncbi:hypothetical protein D6D15_05022 [Aureobasidium pullulans]|uniref:Apple domain-containing protein n=1 Tax=Aureobasidium pullulans TaxID=5580 RepID=A0A4S9B9N9_AURPU|nr:hypothetical protein D6D15_05022 [Aureobasidium pullulans]
MRPYSALLAIGFAALVSGQTPGSDGQITVATATCTAIDTQTYAVTDAQGILYRYQCGAGTFGAQFSAVPSSSVGNWTACFAFCDNAPGCSGFTYVNGAPNGNGPGGCNLKSGTAQSLNSDGLVSTRIGAIMARYGPKPAPTNSCPAQNLQTITDFNGVNYVVACGNDTNGNGVTALGANYGFNECFDKCDSYTASTSPSVCNAFQWVGTGANGSSRGYTDYCLFGLLVEFLFFKLGIVISVIFEFKFCLELFVVFFVFILFFECIVCFGCSCLFCCPEYTYTDTDITWLSPRRWIYLHGLLRYSILDSLRQDLYWLS